jgi:hypothetical protein
MKATLLFLGLTSALAISDVAAFDYSPPILESSRQASMGFGRGERLFYYSIISELYDPFTLPDYHRISLSLVNEGSGRVLRSGPRRIQFSRGEDVSSSSEEYRSVGGGNRLWMGGYEAIATPEGWSYNDLASSLDWWRQLTEVLIGVRFQREDGIHHGWIRFSRADTHFTTVFQPKDYDWHPIPGAPIPAGLPPVIPITTTVTDGELHLTWSRSLVGWVLESTGVLANDAVWIRVPEAFRYEARLVITDSNRYFRLRKP